MLAPSLTGDGLILRPFEQSDVNEAYRAIASAEDLAWTTTPYWRPMTTKDVARHLLEPGRPTYTWAIVPSDGANIPAGKIDVIDLDLRHRRAEVGIAIWRKEHRGRGLGREAIRSTINWLNETGNVHRLQAKVIDGNEPSLRTFQSLDFDIEARLRDFFWIRDQFRDGILLSRLTNGPRGMK